MKLRTSIKLKAWKPSAGLLVAMLIVSGAVAFAIWESNRGTVTGNTIETHTVNMQVSRDGVSFSNTAVGHDYSGVVPGSAPVPSSGFPVYIKNTGDLPLSLNWSISSAPSNPDNVDLSKVRFYIAPMGGTAQDFAVQSMIDNDATGGLPIKGDTIAPNSTKQYNIQVGMDTDAVDGASAALGNIDLAFTGTYDTSP